MHELSHKHAEMKTANDSSLRIEIPPPPPPPTPPPHPLWNILYIFTPEQYFRLYSIEIWILLSVTSTHTSIYHRFPLNLPQIIKKL